MVNFVIMHQTVTTHDAIGNDIELMSSTIKKKHMCYVYADNKFNDNVEYIDENRLDSLLSDDSTVVIYHHSVYWEYGYEKVKKAKGIVIVKYHNITPESFFEPYNEFAYEQCRMGRLQTELMQRELPNAFWLCDSEYNTKDISVDSNQIGVCPPFNKIEQWCESVPDETVLRELIDSGSLNILFVGRVAPNKGHLMLIDILRTYVSNYDKDVKLRVIGKFDDGIIGYNNQVKDRIREYGLESLIEFIGEVNDKTLMAYYLGSDMMLCCSEHEGFCVPVIEAQSFGLPVIALNACAVPDTIGQFQVVLENDVKEFAAAIKILKEHRNKADFLAEKGRENYILRFTQQEIERVFKEEIEKMTGVEL